MDSSNRKQNFRTSGGSGGLPDEYEREVDVVERRGRLWEKE